MDVIYLDKKHRAKNDGFAWIPQWRGLLFWHNYTLWVANIWMGNAVLYSKRVTPPSFDTGPNAIRFIERTLSTGKDREYHLDDEDEYLPGLRSW